MHLFRKKNTLLLKPITQLAREAGKKVNVCVTMWIIVTPSPRRKPCASCSKNNRKWPGVFIALLCLSWSYVLHRLLWSFSWERIQLVSAGDLHAFHPICSLLNLHSPFSAFLCFLKVCCILGLLCSWHDGPPPRSANRNPGNQYVWPKPICFTRFTNPQWDVTRKKKKTKHQSPHTPVVLNFWKMQSILHQNKNSTVHFGSY